MAANHHFARVGKTPCEDCGHREYCAASGDSCPQFRLWVEIARVRKHLSRVPDGVGINDKSANAERECVGLLR